MHILLGGRHLASTIGIGDVPDRRQLVHRQRSVGQTQHAAVDLAKQAQHGGQSALDRHRRMDGRLRHPRGVLDVQAPVTPPIGQPRADPHRRHEPLQRTTRRIIDATFAPALARKQLTKAHTPVIAPRQQRRARRATGARPQGRRSSAGIGLRMAVPAGRPGRQRRSKQRHEHPRPSPAPRAILHRQVFGQDANRKQAARAVEIEHRTSRRRCHDGPPRATTAGASRTKSVPTTHCRRRPTPGYPPPQRP